MKDSGDQDAPIRPGGQARRRPDRRSRHSRTTDQQLLDSRAPEDWLHTDPWRVLRIVSEFVEGFESLAELGPAVSVFGSARSKPGSEEYLLAEKVGAALAEAGYAVITGGGPGAMEAANLGAYLAPSDDAALDEGLARLGRVPGFADDVGSWADAGFDIRQTLAPQRAGVTVGVPTFFYGHEPPNVFASHIAKYFANSIREDGLLARSNAGVVVLPGAAGTVQEIFQAATPSYYAPGDAAPIVLVDREHWTERLPAWPLLRALASGRGMADRIHLVDSVDEVPALL